MKKASQLLNIYEYVVVESTNNMGPCRFCKCPTPGDSARIRISDVNYCVDHALEKLREWALGA
jgi:hypothetical protein